MPRVSRLRLCTVLVAFLTAAGASVPAAAADPPPGGSGPAVLRLQLALYEAGADVPLSASLDGATETALASLHLDPSATLAPGQSGPAVVALQRALTAAGYPVEATGRFGPLTATLVRRFQQDHGERPTGDIDLDEVERATALYTVLGDADGLVGSPYAWGGASPSTGFDCSGLVRYVYGQVGIAVPHSSYAQWDSGMPVPAGELQPGDLVFFSAWGPGPSHVGIYIGGGEFVHAGTPSTGVHVSSLGDPYWFARYVGARRLL